MKVYKHFPIALLTGLMLFMLTACGGADQPAASEPAAEAPAAEEEAASGGEQSGSSIEVMAQWGGPEQAGFEEVTAAFTEETGIKVTYISERDLTQVLPTRIAGGNPPDVAMVSRPGQIQEFISDGVVFSYADLGVDLDAIQNSYAKSVLDLGTFDGKLYGLLTASNSKSTFWYKPASFKEQGFKEPETWDELMAIVDGYVAAGKTPLSIGGQDGWTLTDWFENLYVRVAGPENYVKLFVTHEIKWTDPTVVKTMEHFRDIISPTDVKLAGGAAGTNSTGFIDALDLMLNGKAEMYYEGGFMGNFARQNFPKLEGGKDYTFFPFPEIDPAYGKPVVGGGDFAVAFSNKPETAAFLNFLASAKANEIWAQAKEGARITPNKNASADLFADPLTKLEAAAIKSADIFVFDGSDLAPSAVGGDAMFTGLQQFIEKPDDIQGVLELIESAAAGAY
jgi:alpha-glucoside transport system substrate-binding protein